MNVLDRITDNHISLENMNDFYAHVTKRIGTATRFELTVLGKQFKVHMASNVVASIAVYCSGSVTPNEDMILDISENGINLDIVGTGILNHLTTTIYPDTPSILSLDIRLPATVISDIDKCRMEALAKAYIFCMEKDCDDTVLLSDLEREFHIIAKKYIFLEYTLLANPALYAFINTDDIKLVRLNKPTDSPHAQLIKQLLERKNVKRLVTGTGMSQYQLLCHE